MRVIDAFDEPVRAAAVSPDGRFLAAATADRVTVLDWVSGAPVVVHPTRGVVVQVAPAPDGSLAVGLANGRVELYWPTATRPPTVLPGPFSGAVAVSPDGKTLVATRAGHQELATLERWELPARRAATGFAFWSPFDRLGFSPNGEFLAGINRGRFELRIAVTGGLNGRRPTPRQARPGFFTFSRDSQTVVFGWDAEFHVMETRNGNVSRRVPAPDTLMFADAAFTGSGRQLATVNGTPVMLAWAADTWQVARGYDWGAGGLTCLAVAPDGLAGVCGTDAGKLVVFDVDE